MSQWNLLPSVKVRADALTSFKTRLEKYFSLESLTRSVYRVWFCILTLRSVTESVEINIQEFLFVYQNILEFCALLKNILNPLKQFQWDYGTKLVEFTFLLFRFISNEPQIIESFHCLQYILALFTKPFSWEAIGEHIWLNYELWKVIKKIFFYFRTILFSISELSNLKKIN